MYKILTLNNISVKGLELLPRTDYEIASEIQHPDAVLLRSYKLHDWDVPASLKAVGRAGAGVNNIPVDKLTQSGIVVFNAPGANANAVKELVIAGMLLSARNLLPAWDYTRQLTGDDASLNKTVEAAKKQFVGYELAGRSLGIIGLGEIGVKLANAAIGLGMRVVGYDPYITVKNAWQLSSQVIKAASVDEVLAQVDFVSLHVPLVEATKNLLNAERVARAKDGLTILNFAREGIVDNQVVLQALDSGKLQAYICDFPANQLLQHPKVVIFPHLGASTLEAEDNCAMMVAEQVRDYLEHGNIKNSVNFPEMYMPRSAGHRLLIVNANVPHMIEQISKTIANANLNILDMLNRSREQIACTLVDVSEPLADETLAQMRQIEGILAVRKL